MTYWFSVEHSNCGQYRIAVRDADRAMVMASTSFSRERTGQAIETFRSLLKRDWCYRIINQRKTGLCFELHLPHSGIRCVSRQFSSCDAMEREIGSLKAAAGNTFLLHLYDKKHSPMGPERGDENNSFAARLRELA